MKTKNITKILAALLAFMLSFANVALLGNYTSSTLAASANLEKQDTAVDKSKIEFDAYFEKEGENTHSVTLDVSGEEKLHLRLKVEEGYLTNASIKVDNANFRIQETSEELNVIQSIVSSENRIGLNQIERGESVLLEVPIKIDAGSNFASKDLSKTASIMLEGTYVNNKGKEVNVNKTIEVETTIDGTAEAELSADVSKYVVFDVSRKQRCNTSNFIKIKISR